MKCLVVFLVVFATIALVSAQGGGAGGGMGGNAGFGMSAGFGVGGGAGAGAGAGAGSEGGAFVELHKRSATDEKDVGKGMEKSEDTAKSGTASLYGNSRRMIKRSPGNDKDGQEEPPK